MVGSFFEYIKTEFWLIYIFFSIRNKCVSLLKNSDPSATAGDALNVPLSWFVANLLNLFPVDKTVVLPSRFKKYNRFCILIGEAS